MGFIDTPYNLTLLQKSITVSDLVSFANTSTGGILSGLFVVIVFFILMITLKRASFVDTLAASSFIIFILSIFMLLGGFISFFYVLAFLLLTGFSIFYMVMVKKG